MLFLDTNCALNGKGKLVIFFQMLKSLVQCSAISHKGFNAHCTEALINIPAGKEKEEKN